MSKTKAQLIEEINALKNEYKNVKEILMDAWAEGDDLKEKLEHANSHMLSLQNANTELRNSYDNANSALETLKNDYQKTKEYASEVTFLNGHLEQVHAAFRSHIDELLEQIEEHKRTEHLLLNETHKAKGELLKYRRRYKALLNAVTPMAAAIIFLSGMVIWLMI